VDVNEALVNNQVDYINTIKLCLAVLSREIDCRIRIKENHYAIFKLSASIGAEDILQKWSLEYSIRKDIVFQNAAYHGHFELCRWAYENATDDEKAHFYNERFFKQDYWLEEDDIKHNIIYELLLNHANETGNTAVTEWLWPLLSDQIKEELERHDDFYCFYFYFFEAAKHGHLNVCKLIVQYFPKKSYPSITEHSRILEDPGPDALSAALNSQHLDVCQWLWDRMTNEEHKNFKSYAYHYFAEFFCIEEAFNIDLAEWLLSKFSCESISIEDDSFKSRFIEEFKIALKHGYLQNASWLLKNNLLDYDKDNFATAIEHGQDSFCRWIYENATDLNQGIIRRKSPKFFIACLKNYLIDQQSRYIKCIQLLLQIDPFTISQVTPTNILNQVLNLSVRNGIIECTKLLLDAGADPNATIPETETVPLVSALSSYHLRKYPSLFNTIQRLLISSGANLQLAKIMVNQNQTYSKAQKQAYLESLQQVEKNHIAHQKIVKACCVMNQGLLDSENPQRQNPFRRLPPEIRCRIAFFIGRPFVSKKEATHLHNTTTGTMKRIMADPKSSYSLKLQAAKHAEALAASELRVIELEQALKTAEEKIAGLESKTKRLKVDPEVLADDSEQEFSENSSEDEHNAERKRELGSNDDNNKKKKKLKPEEDNLPEFPEPRNLDY